MKSAEKILVLIINYKTSNLMQGLIDSIKESSADLSILIVDNSSTPDSFKELQGITDPRVRLLRSDENLGFTGGLNFAIRHESENQREYKYLFLLNPDAFSTPELIGNLKGIMQENPRAAAVSPKVVYMNGDPWYSGAVINFRKGRVLNDIPAKSLEKKRYCEVDVFSGCAVLFDFDKLKKVGLFSEDLFMYYDEAELSIRLKKPGYQVIYTPEQTILHDVSYTTRNISYMKTYYMTRNKFIVFNDTMTVGNKIYFLLYELAFHLKNKRIKNALFHMKGYYHFLRGKKGQYQAA